MNSARKTSNSFGFWDCWKDLAAIPVGPRLGFLFVYPSGVQVNTREFFERKY